MLLALLAACGGPESGGAPGPGGGSAEVASAGAAPAGATPAADPSAVPPPATAAPTPLRIGWQTTWATQGQLVAVLQHTDLLADAGFAAEFVGFPYGGPLNEGALAGAVDVLFTADQPALTLASKAPRWGVIGRLMYNRVGLFVPADSAVAAPADLRGKTVAVPFGSAAQRNAIEAVRAAGLDSHHDVRLVNLGVEEVLGVVRAGASGGRWGTVDAAAAWDPPFAEIERAGARVVAEGRVTAVVVMDDAYVAAHPGADARFMEALASAWAIYRADPARADGWFVEASKLPFAPEVLTRAASVEPNVTGPDPVRVHLTDDDRARLDGVARFMHEADLLSAPLDVGAVVRPAALVPRAPRDPAAVPVRP